MTRPIPFILMCLCFQQTFTTTHFAVSNHYLTPVRPSNLSLPFFQRWFSLCYSELKPFVSWRFYSLSFSPLQGQRVSDFAYLFSIYICLWDDFTFQQESHNFFKNIYIIQGSILWVFFFFWKTEFVMWCQINWGSN